jgi:hypothetical protein
LGCLGSGSEREVRGEARRGPIAPRLALLQRIFESISPGKR